MFTQFLWTERMSSDYGNFINSKTYLNHFTQHYLPAIQAMGPKNKCPPRTNSIPDAISLAKVLSKYQMKPKSLNRQKPTNTNLSITKFNVVMMIDILTLKGCNCAKSSPLSLCIAEWHWPPIPNHTQFIYLCTVSALPVLFHCLIAVCMIPIHQCIFFYISRILRIVYVTFHFQIGESVFC